MPELYLRLLTRILTPVLLVLAIYLFLRGHNLPGGGFIAGLVAAVAIEFQILGRGDRYVRRRLGPWIHPIAGIGLLSAVVAAILGLVENEFFDSVWVNLEAGEVELELGTPVLFDFGVFLIVIAVVTSFLLGLSSRYGEAEQ